MIEERPIEVVTSDGEVLTDEQVRYAYSREGRWKIGKEYPNPVPMEPPIGYVPAKPLYEQIREMVVRELSAAAEESGLESAEDADDFEVGDDYDPESPYEMDFDPAAPWPGTPAVVEAEQAAVETRSEGGGGSEAPQAESK